MGCGGSGVNWECVFSSSGWEGASHPDLIVVMQTDELRTSILSVEAPKLYSKSLDF